MMVNRLFGTLVAITVIIGLRYVLKAISDKVTDSSIDNSAKRQLLIFSVIIGFECLFYLLFYAFNLA